MTDARLPPTHPTALASPRVPTSTILQDLLLHAPEETVTLGWLMGNLGDRSFGIILLLLGLLASLPGVSAIVGVIIAFPACQMILARRSPVLPRFVAARTFPKQRLASMLIRVDPPLRYLERFIRPRWQTPLQMTKRVVGGAILLVGALLFVPLPLSNVPPALVVVLLSFAYLEEDGVLLCIALSFALALLLIAAGTVWQAISATGWVGGLL
nr:exopolysaccharide biosynthesis protein [Limobrevibacterium gyesilva]